MSIEKYCDACGKEARNKYFVSPSDGPCGDSFCYASCDLRSCRGAAYDWCKRPECAKRMLDTSFVSFKANLTKPVFFVPTDPDDDDIEDLRNAIEDAKKVRITTDGVEINKVKKFLTKEIVAATTAGRSNYTLSRSTMSDLFTLIRKHDLVLGDWLNASSVSISTYPDYVSISWE